MVALSKRYQKNPAIVSRRIVNEVILVPIRQNVGDLESIYTLNDTGACAWALFDEQHTLGDIRDQMVAQFEVEPEQAAQDLDELVVQLKEIGALLEV